MSTTHEVDFGGVHVRGAWNVADGPEPRAELAVYTKSGQARIAQLSEHDLLALITESARALDQLRTRREHVEHEHAHRERIGRSYADERQS